MDLLRSTLDEVKMESQKSGYKVHYAIKANHNPRILKTISSYGFGADCVSGNEVSAAINAGFSPSDIVFAGVGKTDKDIDAAIKAGIFASIANLSPKLKLLMSLLKTE